MLYAFAGANACRFALNLRLAGRSPSKIMCFHLGGWRLARIACGKDAAGGACRAVALSLSKGEGRASAAVRLEGERPASRLYSLLVLIFGLAPNRGLNLTRADFMLLIFKAGENRYALETAVVRRVLPAVALRSCPGAPAYVAGVMNYRGAPVAVIDLCRLLDNSPCRRTLSTRIILAEYSGRGNEKILLGLMAEGATSIKEVKDFVERPLNTPDSEFLGKMFRDGEKLVQLVRIEEIAPPELDGMLAAEQVN